MGYIDTGMPFKTNGVYVRKIEDNLLPRKKGIIGAFEKTFGKKEMPYYSFLFIQDRHNRDVGASFEERFIVSSFVMQGELFSLVRGEIKRGNFSHNAKNLRFEGNKLSFRYFLRYMDGSTTHEMENDDYECTFYENSCRIIRTTKKKKERTESEYKFIEIEPTTEDLFNLKRR